MNQMENGDIQHNVCLTNELQPTAAPFVGCKPLCPAKAAAAELVR